MHGFLQLQVERGSLNPLELDFGTGLLLRILVLGGYVTMRMDMAGHLGCLVRFFKEFDLKSRVSIRG